MPTRPDGRDDRALRPTSYQTGFQRNPEGSVLYRCGGTSVLCACSIEERVPPFLEGRGSTFELWLPRLELATTHVAHEQAHPT